MNVLIYTDGGSRGNPGPGAAAYVIKNAEGKIISQEGYFIPDCTNNHAEYTALQLALVKAAELGAKEVDIRTDSLLMVKQYLGEFKIKHPNLAEIMGTIRVIAARFKKVRIQHVPREQNKEADALANKAMDAKQTVGFNPIEKLVIPKPVEKPAAKPAADSNIVNGVEVQPVSRKPASAPKKKKPVSTQLSLFDDL